MRALAPGILAGLLVVTSARAQTPDAPTQPLTLEAAIQEALSANPAVLAARARQAIGTAGVAVARERLNPEARVELDRDTPRQAYTLALPLETGGKRGRRIAVAEAGVRTTEAGIAVVLGDTRNLVRRAYVDLLIAEGRLALLDDLRTIATRARDAAQQRFDAGDAPRLEVLQAALALAQAENDTTGARGAVTAARAQLNALLGRPLDASTRLAPPNLGVGITFAAAMARARAASTALALLDRQIDEQRARISLATSLRKPDVTPEFSVTHGFGDGAEFQTGWKGALAVSIPIFTTHTAGVVLEQSTLTQLTAEREAALARISAEVASATAVADAQRQQYLRYRDEIIPQAVNVEQLAEDSYRLGQTGITAYLLSLQATREARLRSLQSEADLQSALADLERAMGAPLQP